MARVGSRFKKIFEEAQRHPAYWMEDLRLQFLEGISAIMESQGITQKELADRMGVSEAYISRVFNDNVEKNFTLNTLVELSKAVNAEIKIIVTPKKAKGSDLLYQQEWFKLLQSLDCLNEYENIAHDETLSRESHSHEDKSLKPVAA